MTLRVIVNGRPRVFEPGSTVADAVAALMPAPPGAPGSAPGPAPGGIAVAVNDEVVPRASWPSTVLADADRVEVLTAVQGG